MERDEQVLRNYSSDFMKREFLVESLQPFEYEMERIPVGITHTGDIYYLNMKHALRCLIMGRLGSGKTFLLRGIMDRCKMAGYDIFLPTDIKDEMKSSRKPVQYKFKHKLLDREMPTGAKIVTLRPTFFKEVSDSLPSNNFWTSVNLAQMTKADFKTLVKGGEMTVPQQTMIELLYAQIEKNKENFNIKELDAVIDSMGEHFNHNQRMSMKVKFAPIKDSHFSVEKYYRDIPDLIKRGYITAINMEGFDLYGREASYAYPEVFVGLTLRQVIWARRKKKLKPLITFVDEAARFIPKNGNPSCKKDFIESCQVDRGYGIWYFYVYQFVNDVPNELMNASRYIFVPQNANVDVIKDILIAKGLVQGHPINAVAQASRIKQRMKKWQWLIIDTENNTKDIVDILAPLSNHKEQAN